MYNVSYVTVVVAIVFVCTALNCNVGEQRVKIAHLPRGSISIFAQE